VTGSRRYAERHAGEHAPDLTSLAASAGAVRLAPSTMPVALAPPRAQVTVVDGDAAIDGAVSGAGILYVSGHVRIAARSISPVWSRLRAASRS